MNKKKGLFPILALVLALGLGVVGADNLSDAFQAGTQPGDDVTIAASTVIADGLLIEQVDPATIPCEILADFEDVTGGPDPGTNYDAILVSGGLELAERFSGQTLTYTGNFDVLSGTPSDPLALQIGEPNDNLQVDYFDPDNNVVSGLGHLGYPDYDAIGEGSVAVLFPSPQSQFKFGIFGTSGGSATLNFFRADGSSLGTIGIALTSQTYCFRHTGGLREIAGFSIHNSDPFGIAYDNICYSPPETPSYPSISGTFTGTIIPSQNLTVSTLYTHPCRGTGGHTKSIQLYENTTLIANGTWSGYQDDWHNVTFNEVMLLKDHEYRYVIVTGSYPQIIHEPLWNAAVGVITCTEFVDINGKRHEGWIPAITLY